MRIDNAAWRQMTAWDLPAVENIAAKVHPAFFERPEVFAEKQRLYRPGASLLEVGDRPAGYVFSHPFRARSIPALDALLDELPADADTYYIHDLALLPLARRIGAAAEMVGLLEKHARALNLPAMSLVAVSGSEGFWQKQGFAAVDDEALAPSLAAYDAAARYMVKPLALL